MEPLFHTLLYCSNAGSTMRWFRKLAFNAYRKPACTFTLSFVLAFLFFSFPLVMKNKTLSVFRLNASEPRGSANLYLAFNFWNTNQEALETKISGNKIEPPTCQLPKLDPFSPIVMKLVGETTKLTCKAGDLFTRLEGGSVVVNKTLCKQKNVSEVYFQTILRDPGEFIIMI